MTVGWGKRIWKFHFDAIVQNLCETFTIRTYYKKLGSQDLINLLFKPMTYLFTATKYHLCKFDSNKTFT